MEIYNLFQAYIEDRIRRGELVLYPGESSIRRTNSILADYREKKFQFLTYQEGREKTGFVVVGLIPGTSGREIGIFDMYSSSRNMEVAYRSLLSGYIQDHPAKYRVFPSQAAKDLGINFWESIFEEAGFPVQRKEEADPPTC